ncbi:DUF7507 domain-containing protein [Flavobacterium sp. P21]|uniref:DUF7507 domain-containing protein n=1 Tax=Flavobacterium sp. P21 TaxID=3423948 RepID=UPI003D66BA8D
MLAQVDRFVVTFSGSSDCAFIAFNRNSLKIAELTLAKKATLSDCGKLGDKINYEFEVTNTGEVTITDINVTDPASGTVITGNPIASLAPGAKITLTGVHTITSTDVNLGKVINNTKVTGTDPSLNTVEDLSTPLTTILLTPPAVGTITNITCAASGTVVLSDLPATGTWTLERSPSGSPIYGTGTTTTVPNLPVGTYTFKVTNSTGCKSPASTEVKITNQSSTTWNGSSWSNGDPNITKNVVFTGAYNITTDLEFCSCTINSGVHLTVPSGKTLTIANGLTVTSTASLTFENSSSLLQNSTSNTINTGSINYNRTTGPIRKADYEYWSTPVKNQTLVAFSPLTRAGLYYTHEGSGWINVSSGSTMVPGKGYIIRAPETHSATVGTAFPATFIGTPNNGLVTTGVNGGTYCLIGNPYPSALDADKFITDNRTVVTGTLYFWTHNTYAGNGATTRYTADDYASYNLSGGVGTSPAKSMPGGTAPKGKIARRTRLFCRNNNNGNSIFRQFNAIRRQFKQGILQTSKSVQNKGAGETPLMAKLDK